MSKERLDAKVKAAEAKADIKLQQIKEDREVAATAEPGATPPPPPPGAGAASAVSEVKSKISTASRAALPAPLAEFLASAEFASQCAQSFEKLDADKSGVLEPQESVPSIVALFQGIPIAGPPPTVQQCLIMIASEFGE